MPQLDPSGFSSQLFWLTVSFVFLYLLLAKTLLPRIASILEVRADTIRQSINQAEIMKSEAERVRDAYEKTLSEVKAKAKEVIVNAQSQSAQSFSRRESELSEKIEKKLAASETAIIQAKQNAMAAITPVTGEIATAVIEALALYTPSPAEVAAAVSSHISQRN